MLTSRQPIWIGWGPELIYLYNDPYKSIIGGKHPWALGKPTSVVWREIWQDIGPMLAQAMGGDEGTYVEAQLLIMERNGYPEETYYTFSYSPIPDDDGRVGGIFCANTDDTQRVIGERQLALLRELAATTAEARTWRAGLRAQRAGARHQSARSAVRDDLHPRAGRPRRGRSPARPASIASIRRSCRRWSLDEPGVWPLAEVTADHKPRVVSRAGAGVSGRLSDRRLAAGRPNSAVVLPDHGERRNRPRRLPDRRSQSVPAVRRQLFAASSTLSPGRSPPRIANAEAYEAGTPARRGAGRDRPRQDGVLLQRQPRVPHAADADARPARGGADEAGRCRAPGQPGAGRRSRIATACGCSSWSTRCSISRASKPGRAQASFEPTDLAS